MTDSSFEQNEIRIKLAEDFIGMKVKEWEQYDTFCFGFQGILTRDIDKTYVEGMNVELMFDFEVGTLSINSYEDKNEPKQYKIKLVIEK